MKFNKFLDFKKETKPGDIEEKKLKRNTTDTINALYEGRVMFLNAFKSGIFLLQPTEGKGTSGTLPRLANASGL